MSKATPNTGATAESVPRTAGDMLRMGREFLTRKGLAQARLEAELLVANALGIERLKLFMDLERPLSAEEVSRGRSLLSRRARGEPIAYITGRREFYARNFNVGPAVLIPRPETELLVDRAREFVRARGLLAPRCLDVGTGSGVIAISLALEIPGASVVAVDISAPALEVAKSNALHWRVSAERVEFIQGDGALAARAKAPFELVISNPPYIALEAKATLAADVRDHEPALALFSPAGDPHHWLRRLLEETPALIAPGGVLLIEIGHDQAAAALELAQARKRAARIHQDLAKLPRILEVEF